MQLCLQRTLYQFVAETPVRVKKLVVEKYLDGQRLKEEKTLLER